ncbi:acyltransferase family protein [Pseudomarimonas arenosa]|uniref:Acyltransferase family protein n=1 Tax=Pseudomarimonas arenosa TaxID=2774145 RepID=A0AAW3ZT07_9GAMM|nr:acyltransferase family protein [Pseudomarimonas arenosa]MBD8528152.1 acyltransferase family protein [Pseudomarimonas arenosa]
MSPVHPPIADQGRRYDVDALRVLAFALLILYHVGMFYVADWGWHVKSAHLSETLQGPMLVLNQWRMPLIFMVSGLALSFVIERYQAGALAAKRTSRLLIPLLFGMLVIVPPQAYFQALANSATEPGYVDFLLRYFSFQPWPEDAFSGSEIGITWNHLWYLPYLWLYTLLLIPLSRLLRSDSPTVARLRALRGWKLVVLPTLPLLVYGLTLFPVFGGIKHDLLTDGYAHAMFFTFFLYGYLIGRDPGLWQALSSMRWWSLGLAILAFVVLRVVNEWLPEDRDLLQQVIGGWAVYLNRWLWLMAVLGWAHRLLNRPFSWLPYATEAVYPWYILHQTLIVVAGVYLSRLGLGPVWEPIAVILATMAGCALLHELLIRRISWLRPLFGLAPKRRAQAGPVESAEPARLAG